MAVNISLKAMTGKTKGRFLAPVLFSILAFALYHVFADALFDSIHGELNAESMQTLNSQQITLLAYKILRDEVMDGGFVELIHNGYGPFIFLNPFAKAMRLWGQDVEADTGTAILHDFSRLVYKGRKLFERYGDELTRPCTDEEFMALFEQYPDFDDLDDEFVETEEAITSTIAYYIDAHLDDFVEVTKDSPTTAHV